jgi:hypothetical protein
MLKSLNRVILFLLGGDVELPRQYNVYFERKRGDGVDKIFVRARRAVDSANLDGLTNTRWCGLSIMPFRISIGQACIYRVGPNRICLLNSDAVDLYTQPSSSNVAPPTLPDLIGL